MSTTTDVLSLFKYDPVADADSTFNITQGLNNNWDKLDAAILLAIAAAGAYNPEESYAVGDYCTYKGKLRKCSTAIPTGETWTEAHWTTTTVAAELAELSSQLSNRLRTPIEIPKYTNLNAVKTPGMYYCGAAMESPNIPPNPLGEGAFSLLVESTYTAGVSQTLTWYVSGKTHKRLCTNTNDDEWIDWVPIATAMPPQIFDLPLTEDMQPFPNYGSNKYWKNQFNEVTLTISVTKTDMYTNDIDNGSVICYLPAGFRPAQAVGGSAYAMQYAETKFPAFIVVNPDGSVRIFQAQEVKCSMVVASISFVAAT